MSVAFPEPAFVDADGVRLALYETDGDPQRRRPPVVLVHGWPEIAYSWKNQLPALAAAGWRTIALDLKGFGRSDAPAAINEYDIVKMTGDLAALLNALEIDRAVFCGHDWGGAIVWPMAQLRPDLVAGVIGVSTPHAPPPPVPPLSIFEKRYTKKHYIVQFQKDGEAEALFARDVERFFRIMFRGPPANAAARADDPATYDLLGRFANGPAPDPDSLIMSEDDLSVYVETYQHSGFRGGINLYRNIDRNYELMKSKDPTIRAPSLWIGAEKDMFLPPERAEAMKPLVPDLETHVIPDSGHWVMWEKPAALNALLIDWLDRRICP